MSVSKRLVFPFEIDIVCYFNILINMENDDRSMDVQLFCPIVRPTSMDWLKGTLTGTPIFLGKKKKTWFPHWFLYILPDSPLNPSLESQSIRVFCQVFAFMSFAMEAPASAGPREVAALMAWLGFLR